MAGLTYKYIPLESATLIQRRHPRDIEPPGMTDIKNMIISRSDKSLTLRPDFDVTPEYVLALGSKLKNGTVTEDEFLNSVVGLYGTGELIWITSTVPVVSDAREIKCSILNSSGTTVTVTGLLGSISDDTNYLCTLSSSSIINASEDIWSGCYIKFSGQSFLYRISSVASETEFYIDESPGGQANAEFDIYRPHNIINLNRKANIQTFGSNIIYGIPCGIDNSSINRISGPFYTLTTDATSSPGYYLYEITSIDTGINSGVEDNSRPILFTKDSPVALDSRFFGITPPRVLYDESPGIMTATAQEILDEEEWTSITDDLLTGVNKTVSFGSITSDGTDLYLSGQISEIEEETFSDGFESGDGYGINDEIDATAAWDTSTAQTFHTVKIASDDSEQCSKWTVAPDTSGHGWSITWFKDAEPVSINDIYPNWDIYARINTKDFGSSGGYWGSGLFSIGLFSPAESYPSSSSGYCITVDFDINNPSDSYFNFGKWSGGHYAPIESESFEDVIVEEDGEYWVRIAQTGSQGERSINASVWTGNVGDEPAAWMYTTEASSYWVDQYPGVLAALANGSDNDNPIMLMYELTCTFSSIDETDRTTFVHKFDESESPSFTDVSPANGFTEYYGSGRFSTNFVYDTINTSLVLGFVDSQNYINLSDYPKTESWIRYSTDGGSNWSTPASMEGYFLRGLFYSVLDSKLYAPCIVYTDDAGTANDWDIVIRMSDDGGATWTDYVDLNDKLGLSSPPKERWGFFEDDTNWCLLFPNRYYMFGGEFTPTAWSDSGLIPDVEFLNSAGTDGNNYDNIAFFFSANQGGQYLYSLVVDTDASTVSVNGSGTVSGDASPGSYWSQIYPLQVLSWANRQYVSLCPQKGPSTPNNVYYSIINVEEFSGNSSEAEVSTFYPISDIYRSNVFSVLDGYLVLFGTAEYDSGDDSWSYTTRRIRWTAPNAVTDFTGVGSGVGEVPGNGIFLDARAVNGRIVTFETSSIGALVPRGIVADPWDYDVIYEGIKILSNPCVVEDKCYFIASDGLLHVTNGIGVEEAGSSFDMSLYDDFTEESPIWLIYSSKLKSLLVFYPESSDNVVYMINLATGSVSYMTIPLSDESTSSVPFSVVSIENSSDQRVFISYDLFSGTGISISKDGYSELVIGELSPGDGITGIDSLYESGDDHYWYGQFDTGNIFIEQEGIKCALKHVIIHTYTDAAVGETDMPDIIVEVKSLEDSLWNGPRDPLLDGSITMTTSACTIDSSSPPTAMSNILGTANGAAITYDLPWPAANCRIYTYTGGTYTVCTLVTSTPTAVKTYQITGTQEIKVMGTNGHIVYCFCENEPFVKTTAGDYVESDEGFHRINSITNYCATVLDRYKATGTDTCTQYTAEQMPVGHGQVKIGINRLVEGVQLRVMVMPRHGTGTTDTQPTVAKITGISLGYIPLGEKILEATGG